jgi:hypothetical protein
MFKFTKEVVPKPTYSAVNSTAVCKTNSVEETDTP